MLGEGEHREAGVGEGGHCQGWCRRGSTVRAGVWGGEVLWCWVHAEGEYWKELLSKGIGYISLVIDIGRISIRYASQNTCKKYVD